MLPIADERKLTDKAYVYWSYRKGVVTPSRNQVRLLASKDAEHAFGSQ
jgi:hypothetical protein